MTLHNDHNCMYISVVQYVLCNCSLVGNGVGSAGACALANIIMTSSSLEEIWYVELETGYTCIDNVRDICKTEWMT